jgi:hypothetical protein
MGAQHVAQRGMQQMGRGMVAAGGGAPVAVDLRLEHGTDMDGPAGIGADMRAGLALAPGILDREDGVAGDEAAAIAHLAARLRVERRAVQEHQAALARRQRLHRLALAVQGDHAPLVGVAVVAGELARGVDAHLARQLGAEAAGLARAFLLHRHVAIEAGVIDAQAVLARDVRGEVEREAIGVVQTKGDLAGDGRRRIEGFVARFLIGGGLAVIGARDQAGHGLVEHLHAVGERLLEAAFLLQQHPLDQRPLVDQFGEGLAHLGHQRADQAMEERLAQPELMAVARGPADDAPQDVAAPLVRRQHAVDNQEGAGADVVGDYPQRGVVAFRAAGHLGSGGEQALEQVDSVVVVHALHDGGDALEAHARVHAGGRQRVHRALAVAVVLHEHEVPDLDEAVAVLIGRTWRAAGDIRAVIKEDLAARPARSGIAHLPEVVAAGDTRKAPLVDADLVQPDSGGVVVIDVDGDPELVRRQAEGLGEKVPGEADPLRLEVIAEAEVAHHLEKRVMTSRVADVLEIVVLAAGAHATLRGHGAVVVAALVAKEHVLELDHAGVSEQQRGIVGGYERRRRHDPVPMRLEVVQKAPA